MAEKGRHDPIFFNWPLLHGEKRVISLLLSAGVAHAGLVKVLKSRCMQSNYSVE